VSVEEDRDDVFIFKSLKNLPLSALSQEDNKNMMILFNLYIKKIFSLL
jgi:hypothetical protein